MRPLTSTQLLNVLALLLPVAVVAGCLVGPTVIPAAALGEGLSHLVGLSSDPLSQSGLIVSGIRLPRVLLSALTGATLACCGAVLQGLFRNPLADPTVIGVAAGASAGASAAIVFGSLFLAAGTVGLPVVGLGAFVGGLLASIVVYRLATSSTGTSVATMLLAGIAISSLAAAISNLLSYLADNDMLRRISLWQMGNLNGADWARVAVGAGLLAMLLPLFCRDSRALNAMLLGESEARHLGIGVEWLKRRQILLCSMGIGVSISIAGLIAFVGLIIPHLVRLLIGPDHRYLLPAAAMAGAILLVLADVVARVVLAPAELPTGILTALLGVPFFVSLLIQQRRHTV
ncbi:iron ABC transporter permease [Porticoccus sp. W117]|uniref:FecCD family ABC transporter permease n=1 Tax=Porticoccus sp. W117 TaxID=3054777 RepID=UPI002593AABF|nr:iron ABC transporter permease [Porticoccus sp. W117]MDM3871418.1 iron ABC transporter permease [Porticoccus sp. W117]